MLRMFARRRSSVTCTTNTDRIIAGMTLPKGSTLNNVSGIVEMQGDGLANDKIGYWALEGWIIPVVDPDAALSLETLWDRFIPKDTDTTTLDLDTGATDTTPFNEPGEPDWTALFDIGLRPQRIYRAQGISTFASPTSYRHVIPSTDALAFKGLVSQKIKISKRYRVSQPSVVVFAIASPVLDDTTAVVETVLTEQHMGQVQFMEHVLERAMLDLIGLTETGAETPWEEATALLQAHLEPDVFEETAATWATQTWRAATELTFDHSVMGRMGKQAVTTGR